MITIVGYGLGNVAAFANAYKRMNVRVKIASTASELAGADRLILPGVGAFDHAMDLLDASGMRETLACLVTVHKRPVLGVCVGMQLLGYGSDEGTRDGLGWIPGRVRQIAVAADARGLPLPHMGWNDVTAQRSEPLFRGLEDRARFYFLHSYYFDCERTEHSSATANYGMEFSCAVQNDNVFGVQFHPEKSHHFGEVVLKNFAEA